MKNTGMRTVWATATNDASQETTTRTGPIAAQGFKVQKLVALCTVAQTAATATITVNRETQAGSTTNDVQICTFPLTVANFGTIGNIGYVDVSSLRDTDLAPGESISFLSDGGGDTGTYWFGVIGYEYAEGPDPVVAFTAEDKPRSGRGDIVYIAATDGTHA